ncbi:hypothetical protein V1517DRAFT_324715 [Lipomyces orientalis]|uniref:Uncharacterized protein n=1 Tax=Lipomyces orientalis TaxID=1233043 RepID=A0ACC3TLL8_9ASCO
MELSVTPETLSASRQSQAEPGHTDCGQMNVPGRFMFRRRFWTKGCCIPPMSKNEIVWKILRRAGWSEVHLDEVKKANT